MTTVVCLAQPVIWTVCSSGCTTTSVQTAITNAATAQDASLPSSCVPYLLVLTAGQTFTGQINLSSKSCSQYIRVRSSRLGELTADVRAGATQTSLMAKITQGGLANTMQTTTDGVNYYAFEGLEITTSANPAYSAIIQIGSGIEDTYTKLPHHIVFDRNWIHGVAQVNGPKRGLSLNGMNIIITNNSFTENHAVGSDSQAILCSQCMGPIYVRNNLMSSGAGAFYAGGGGCTRSGSFPGAPNANTTCLFIPGASEGFFTFLGNDFWKDPTWSLDTDVDNPFGPHTAIPTRVCIVGEYYLRSTNSQWYQCTNAGGTWVTTTAPAEFVPGFGGYTLKSGFELKDGRQIVLTGNTLRYTFLNNGSPNDDCFTINQQGNANGDLTIDVQDILVSGNRCIQTHAAVSLGNGIYIYPGLDPYWHNNAQGKTRRVTIKNNVFDNIASLAIVKGIPNTYSRGSSLIGPSPYDYGTGPVVQANIGFESFVFQHNTVYSAPDNGLASMISSNGDVFPQSDGTSTFADNIWTRGSSSTFQPFVWSSQSATNCVFLYGVPRPLATTIMARETVSGTIDQGSTCATTPTYAGNTWPADTRNAAAATDILTDPANGDFTVNPAFTACKGTAADGRDCGADWGYVSAMTGSAISGTFNQFLDYQIRGTTPTSTAVNIQYTASSTAACTVILSPNLDLSSPIGGASQTRVGKSGSINQSGLTPTTQYYFGITCVSVQLRGTFTTTS